jgi:hypothetical protein
VSVWKAAVARIKLRPSVRMTLDYRVQRGREQIAVTLQTIDIHDGRLTTTTLCRDVPEAKCDIEAAVAWIRQLCLDLLEHELDECLLFDHRQLRDPHALEAQQ